MTLLETLLGTTAPPPLEPIKPAFKLPIEYLPETDVQPLGHNIIADVELCHGADSAPAMYDCITAATTANPIHTKMSRLFTTNTAFLKEYQQIIASLSNKNNAPAPPLALNIATQWREFQANKQFETNYYFMEFDCLKYINRNEQALQMLFILNMIAPVLTLLSPLMVFITPFFMLKFMSAFKFTDVKITMSLYWTIVKGLIANLAIVKLFRLSREHSMQEILMTIVYAVLFVYTNYQNIVACSTFHRKMTEVYDFLNQLHVFGLATRQRIEHYKNVVQHIPLDTHKPFMHTMEAMNDRLATLIATLDPIKESWNGWSINTVRQIGYTMRVFYELKKDSEHDELVTYLIELNQYMDFIEGVATSYKKGVINAADVDANTKGIKFIDNYYAAHILQPVTPIKNTIEMLRAPKDAARALSANMIISGPNASGKTTLMKSVLLNIIFTQQLGVGFYGVGSALKPFKHIHSYLNIPDTSGRDSLFQAEARRCKEILDKIKHDPKESHFVIFDELFSGTNPEEAVKSSTAFIKYLATKTPNTTFMLTTHYKKVCRYFSRKNDLSTTVSNWRMKVNVVDKRFVYTYKLEKGVSTVKGGVYVLKDMGYPQELLDTITG